MVLQTQGWLYCFTTNCRDAKGSRQKEDTPVCALLETHREVGPLKEEMSAGG